MFVFSFSLEKYKRSFSSRALNSVDFTLSVRIIIVYLWVQQHNSPTKIRAWIQTISQRFHSIQNNEILDLNHMLVAGCPLLICWLFAVVSLFSIFGSPFCIFRALHCHRIIIILSFLMEIIIVNSKLSACSIWISEVKIKSSEHSIFLKSKFLSVLFGAKAKMENKN